MLIAFTAFGQKNPRNLEIDWKTDKTKYSIALDEFTALMQPDGIPPIENPKFWKKNKALKNYFLYEPVIALEINGKAKAYPLSILTFHEIVNDTLSGLFHCLIPGKFQGAGLFWLFFHVLFLEV